MIEFRPFRNPDPPKIAAIWNECFTGRGAFYVHTVAFLERSIFSKPYFDRNGLILATENGAPIGFVHAGFGPNAAFSGMDSRKGVICALAVRPAWRTRGIGTALLNQAEQFLRHRGATHLSAGPSSPDMPFYFALYGGSDLPGFLASDVLAAPFFIKRGYRPVGERWVFQRKLNYPITVSDARMMDHRKNYDITIQQRAAIENRWQESVVGLVEPVEFRLESKASRTPVARAILWEMDGYNNRWNVPAAGVIKLIVNPENRQKGIAKFFLGHLMKHLQEQSFGICEAQIDSTDQNCTNLLTKLGFVRVDIGTSFAKDV